MERKLWTPGGDVTVGDAGAGPGPRETSGPASEGIAGGEADLPPDLTEEQVQEIRQALEQLRRIPVADLLLNQINTLTQVAQLHLVPGELDQARLAIDSIRALVDGVGDRLEHVKPQLEELLSQIQLAYVQAASAAKGGGDGGETAGTPTES